MGKAEQSLDKALARMETNELTVDNAIEQLANRKLADVVCVSEFITEDGKQASRPAFSIPRGGSANAADFLVCRMFTDAIFNEDIRTIQLIINRIDGGLPKDTDMDFYNTQFSDCFKVIMQMENSEQLKLKPDDTVMMALCKALYALATQDIYWDPERMVRRRPSTDKKQERDSALRMVLERTGGRKTIPVASKEHDEIETADWVKKLELPAS